MYENRQQNKQVKGSLLDFLALMDSQQARNQVSVLPGGPVATLYNLNPASSVTGGTISTALGPPQETDRGSVITMAEVVRRPLNNVDNHNGNQQSTSFKSWDEWWRRWRILKRSDAIEDIRAKSHFFRCMSVECPYATMVDEDFKNHVSECHKGEDIVCSYCLLGSFTAESLVVHSQKHRSLGYQCSKCTYRASGVEHVLQHQKSHHDIYKVNKNVWRCPWVTPPIAFKRSDGHIQDFRCTECAFQSKEMGEFGLHQSVHPSKSCFVCKAQTSSFHELLQHLKDHGFYDHHCFWCNFADDTREKILNHMCICHPEHQIQFCSRVEKWTFNLEALPLTSDPVSENNENEANVVGQTSCHVGNQDAGVPRGREEKTADESRMKKAVPNLYAGRQQEPNLQSEQPVDLFPCPHCGSGFHSIRELRDHLAFRHNITDIHRCLACNKYFDSRKSLEEHDSKLHSSRTQGAVLPAEPAGKRHNYLCVFCAMQSTDYDEMTRHMRKEVQQDKERAGKRDRFSDVKTKWIKQYLKAQESPRPRGFVPAMVCTVRDRNNCPMCSKVCASRRALLHHLSDHMQFRPYVCSRCPQAFTSYVQAMGHADSVHSERVQPFRCICLSFVENWLLRIVFSSQPHKWPKYFCGINGCNESSKKVRVMVTHFRNRHPTSAFSIREDAEPKASVQNSAPSTPQKREVTGSQRNGRSEVNKNTSVNVQLSDRCDPSASATGETASDPEDHSSEAIANKVRHVSGLTESKSPKSQAITNKVRHVSGLTESKSPKSQAITNKVRHVSGLTESKSPKSQVDDVDNCEENTVYGDSSGTDGETVNLKCSLCTFETPDLQAFQDHNKDNHKSRKARSKASAGGNSRSTSSKKLTPDANRRTGKAAKGSRKPLNCPLCKYQADSAAQLSSHTKKKHPSSAVIGKPRKRKPVPIIESTSESSDNEGEGSTLCSGSEPFKAPSTRRPLDDPSTSREQDESEEPSAREEKTYWSNYNPGKKPEPVDFSKIFSTYKSPSGDEYLKLPFCYYADMFKKELRVNLEDYKKVFLRGGKLTTK